MTKKSSVCMGTLVTQRVYGVFAHRAIECCQRLFESLESEMSVFVPSSDIFMLNASAGKGPVKISPRSVEVLELAQRVSVLSSGAFDVTAGAFVNLWRTALAENRVPDASEIAVTSRLVDYRKLVLDSKHSTAHLKIPGQSVDLGGIAKGYAARLARETYQTYGVKSAVLDLGGAVLFVGRRARSSEWVAGIQHPAKERGACFACVSVVDKCVVTSGGYERYQLHDGIRYHHIIDPSTGYPSNSDLVSCSIVSHDPVWADALSTACFVLGSERAIHLVESIEDTHLILLTSNNEVYVSPSLRDSLRLLDADMRLI